MTDIAGMKAELDALVREQADRRTLREQQGEEIKARSQEYMTKQVQAAERYVQHVREMAQRKTKSGWSTDRSHAGPASAFDAEEYPGPAGFEAAPSPRPVRDEPRAARRPRTAVEDDEDFNNPW